MEQMKFFRKKRIYILVVLVVILLILTIRALNKPKSTESTTVKRGDIKEELTLSGKIAAEEDVVLQFQSTGLLGFVGVKEADHVEKGQLIASLDKTNLEAALRQAWQDYTAAKAESDQYYDSVKGQTTAEDYDQKVERTAVDAKFTKAYDNVLIAQKNLNNASLYSPIDGIATSVSPSSPGVNISLSKPGSYEIANPDTIYLDVSADQTEIIKLHEGQTSAIVFDSYTDEKDEGSIKEISFTPKSDETGTVYSVKVGLNTDNKGYKYKLGMTADVTFVINEKKKVLYIPLTYVKTNEKGKYVLNKKGEKVYVKTGIESDTDVEITDGLKEGDEIYI